MNIIQLLLALYEKNNVSPANLDLLQVVSDLSYCEAISFFDPIGGQLDMGEYLTENAYGFLPVPIEIT
ncbi:hypothetical protein DSB67_19545 [Vibrio campbellii]|nr:hypothetical protein DSB67_19545 [Vibrio campbellii]